MSGIKGMRSASSQGGRPNIPVKCPDCGSTEVIAVGPGLVIKGYPRVPLECVYCRRTWQSGSETAFRLFAPHLLRAR